MTDRIKYLGHSGFHLETSEGKTVLFDPWISGNPVCPIDAEEFEDVDLVLISHDHDDHGPNDVKHLVEECGAVLAAQPELQAYLGEEFGISSDAFLPGMNIGGTVEFDGLSITMVQAFHSSSAGFPCGFILKTEAGNRIYHAGDTGVFATMETLGDLYDINLALLPTGSAYVMDSEQAAHAVSLLRPDKVIPMHYGTFEVLEPDAELFESLVKKHSPEVGVSVLQPGECTDV